MNRHIDHHFDEALASLKQQILLMGSKVEAMLSDCMQALSNRDALLAEKVVEADHAVNALEISIDEHCIQLLARYQPAAGDLRFITRGLKIVTDLERIGDLAVNASQRVLEIVKLGKVPVDVCRMSAIVQKMLKESLDAFVGGNTAKAEGVLRQDDIVDGMTKDYIGKLISMAELDPMSVKLIFPTTSLVRYLERISDHSTNIAELAIYMAKGLDVRHGRPS